MAGEKVYMSWREKLAAAQAVMEVLDKVDTRDGDREREIADVIYMVLRFMIPANTIRLTIERKKS